MKLEEMKPGEIDELLKKAPVVYIPWGSLEWHGVQNPIGLDTLKAYHLCILAAEKTGGVVYPPIYCGYQTMKPYAGFKKTLEMKKETVQSLARDTFEQLYDEGFKIIVVLMGHYGGEHQKALKEVGLLFQDAHKDARIWIFPDYEIAAPKGIVGDHAAGYETSLMMYFRPELVDLKLLPKDREITVQQDGIAGPVDPRKSTKKEGKRIADIIVEGMVSQVRSLLNSL